MIEEEHELDRVAQRAQQEARERAEAEKAGQRATGRVGWGDLRGDLGTRSSGEEAAEERRTSGRSSGDEAKAARRRVGRGAMTAGLMKKRQSKAESAGYNPNPNPDPNPNPNPNQMVSPKQTVQLKRGEVVPGLNPNPIPHPHPNPNPRYERMPDAAAEAAARAREESGVVEARLPPLSLP